jgi:hypothetical protein
MRHSQGRIVHVFLLPLLILCFHTQTVFTAGYPPDLEQFCIDKYNSVQATSDSVETANLPYLNVRLSMNFYEAWYLCSCFDLFIAPISRTPTTAKDLEVCCRYSVWVYDGPTAVAYSYRKGSLTAVDRDTSSHQVLCEFDRNNGKQISFEVGIASATYVFEAAYDVSHYKFHVYDQTLGTVKIDHIEDDHVYKRRYTLRLNLIGGHTYKLVGYAYTHYGVLTARYVTHPYNIFVTYCANKKWGVTCRNDCGHCAANERWCNPSSGNCIACEKYWHPPMCTEYIDINELASSMLNVTVDSVNGVAMVTFQPMNTAKTLAKYYYYTVSYHSSKTDELKQKNVTYGNADPTTVTLNDLDFASVYTVKVIPFRRIVHDAVHDHGQISSPFTFELDCGNQGFWGINCSERCGNCSSGICGYNSGLCKPPTCDLWYTAPYCTSETDNNLTHHHVEMHQVTSTSANIIFQQLGISNDEEYDYYYSVEYWLADVDPSLNTNNQTADVHRTLQDHVIGEEMQSVVLGNLLPNTRYTFRLLPYRRYQNTTQEGFPTAEYTFRTECAAGWYGEQCDQKCGECIQGKCVRSGDCTCKLFWRPPRCKIPIEMPNETDSVIRGTHSSMNDVHIQFEQLSVDTTLDQYYYYNIQYREPGKAFKSTAPIRHSSKAKMRDASIPYLESGKRYVVRVLPTREDFTYRVRDQGLPTRDLIVVTQCPDGKYGYMCSHVCQCAEGACDVMSGVCDVKKCKDWWYTDSCSKKIPKPSMTRSNITVLAVSDTSVTISFKALNISMTMSEYYVYIVVIKLNDTEQDGSEAAVYKTIAVQHTPGTINVTVDGLAPGSAYIFHVTPMMKDIANRLEDSGSPTPQVRVATIPTPPTAPSNAPYIAAVSVGGILACVLVVGLVAGAVVLYTKNRYAKINEIEKIHSDTRREAWSEKR